MGGEGRGRLVYIKYTWSIGCNIPVPSSCHSLVAFNLKKAGSKIPWQSLPQKNHAAAPDCTRVRRVGGEHIWLTGGVKWRRRANSWKKTLTLNEEEGLWKGLIKPDNEEVHTLTRPSQLLSFFWHFTDISNWRMWTYATHPHLTQDKRDKGDYKKWKPM